MRRKIIIIGNKGSVENRLPGVGIDMQNYYDFFRSDEGGAWEEGEITTCNTNLSKESLHLLILSMINTIDYFIIVFVGHGYANDDGLTNIELSPGNECQLCDIKQWLNNKNYLIILDSCRVIWHAREGGQLNEQRLFSSSIVDTEYRKQCKASYNNALEGLEEETHIVAYSTSLGQSANDTSEGGLYSKELLRTTKEIIEKEKNKIEEMGNTSKLLSFRLIHEHVADAIRKETNNEQNPVLQGTKDVPFAVVLNYQEGMPTP